jgi:hypothetical protein
MSQTSAIIITTSLDAVRASLQTPHHFIMPSQLALGECHVEYLFRCFFREKHFKKSLKCVDSRWRPWPPGIHMYLITFCTTSRSYLRVEQPLGRHRIGPRSKPVFLCPVVPDAVPAAKNVEDVFAFHHLSILCVPAAVTFFCSFGYPKTAFFLLQNRILFPSLWISKDACSMRI